MNREPETQDAFMVSSVQEGGRYFVAKQNDRLCAFLKISASGEAFVATGDTYRHITGAYCLPEHRSRGVYQKDLKECKRESETFFISPVIPDFF